MCRPTPSIQTFWSLVARFYRDMLGLKNEREARKVLGQVSRLIRTKEHEAWNVPGPALNRIPLHYPKDRFRRLCRIVARRFSDVALSLRYFSGGPSPKTLRNVKIGASFALPSLLKNKFGNSPSVSPIYHVPELDFGTTRRV
jgi:hypothetical protein